MQGMGAKRKDGSPLRPGHRRKGDLERDPFHPSWFGSAKQLLLAEIVLLFPNADATNGWSAMASAGAVTHPASLGTRGIWMPRFYSVQKGRR